MRDLSPENWDVNGEYRSEVRRLLPVQVRVLPPARRQFTILPCAVRCHQSGVDGGVCARQRSSVLRHSLPLNRRTSRSLSAHRQPDGASRCGRIQSGQHHQYSGSGGARHDTRQTCHWVFSPGRRPRWIIAEVEERRRSRGAVSTAYPYASAFSGGSAGSTRITIREIHHFAPVLTARENTGQQGQLAQCHRCPD